MNKKNIGAAHKRSIDSTFFRSKNRIFIVIANITIYFYFFFLRIFRLFVHSLAHSLVCSFIFIYGVIFIERRAMRMYLLLLLFFSAQNINPASHPAYRAFSCLQIKSFHRKYVNNRRLNYAIKFVRL